MVLSVQQLLGELPLKNSHVAQGEDEHSKCYSSKVPLKGLILQDEDASLCTTGINKS